MLRIIYSWRIRSHFFKSGPMSRQFVILGYCTGDFIKILKIIFVFLIFLILLIALFVHVKCLMGENQWLFLKQVTISCIWNQRWNWRKVFRIQFLWCFGFIWRKLWKLSFTKNHFLGKWRWSVLRTLFCDIIWRIIIAWHFWPIYYSTVLFAIFINITTSIFFGAYQTFSFYCVILSSIWTWWIIINRLVYRVSDFLKIVMTHLVHLSKWYFLLLVVIINVIWMSF